MEPFIERMLERSKTKRILKEQFHAGHNIRERWNLLTNANVLKQTEGKKRISVDKPDDSLKSKKMEADVDLFKNPDSFSKSNDKVSNTLEKVKKSTIFTNNSQLSSKTELKNLSQTLIQLSGLVSNKILLFETKNMDTKTKVSTQASFLERRAVFENKKEETVKPKTRFKRSTLFEKSQGEINKSNTHLSEIKVAESKTYSTKYIDNADKESITATLDQKIKTEMKDNHYIQNNEIDQENDSESTETTSFEDSIMHVFDDLLLSDKLKDSAESNSTIQEYLVLDEIDQCLAGCLNAKELCDDDEREKSLWLEVDTNSGSLTESNQDESERDVLEEKIKKLLDEIYIQEKKIEGASKALNFIQSTDEFNDSTEQVAGEWAMLVATHKRQAALNEVQRLKQNDTFGADLLEMQGCGSLTISDITLPFNQEYFQKMNINTYLHCVCLMSHLGEVVATQAATAKPGDSCLRFTSVLKLDHVYYNFKIDVKVYYFQTKPKCLSHDEKYHINRNLKAKSKSLKKKNQFIIPGSRHTIRSSVFQLMGTTTIKLNNINCKQFTLLGISSHLPLEGHLNMHILSKPSESVEHHGFLTLFEDIANLGNWRRRWYRLKNARLDYWLNPDDEHEKDPIGYLDLEDVFTKNVQFVNREKCARPFTFLLETSRSAQPGDADSFIMKTNGIETTIEYFLLADTKEEGLQWISKLNKTLSLIRTWGPFRD